MMTNEDIIRIKLPELTPVQIRRISNAEIACQNVTSNWGKNFWFNVLKKLCEKYDCMSYFRKVMH